MENKKTLGDEMKDYEGIAAKVALDENQPICVRIDGKTFSTFTRGLQKPFDDRLSNAMIETMNFLVEKSGAQLGYTQSDEITLAFFKMNEFQQPFLGARVQKLTSILASMATARFNSIVSKTIEEKKDIEAFFDARVWNVPTLEECAKVFMWRQEDARKNSISMAAYANFSHKSLEKVNSTEKIKMMLEKGIDWEAFPEKYKTGIFASRFQVEEKLTDEMKSYKSNAGKETYLRTEIRNYTLPRISKSDNLTEAVFSEIFNQRKEIIDARKSKKAI